VAATRASSDWRRLGFLTAHTVRIVPPFTELIQRWVLDPIGMKPTALLVNTSRGPIVDEDALVDALLERKIGGAALDVFDIEPLPERHILRRLENVIATPHIGYVTEGQYQVFYQDAVEDITAFMAGEPIRVVDEQTPAALRKTYRRTLAQFLSQ
jgi:hypothetical protein